MRRTLSGRKSRRQVPAGDTSGWGRPQTAPNCWRPRRRGHAVNQRSRFGTCRYRSPHTPPEARGGRFPLSRARRPATESWLGTSGSRFRQRPKVWTWSVAPQAGVNPIMANPLAAFPNVILFNFNTQGTGRPTGRRHPRAIALQLRSTFSSSPLTSVSRLSRSSAVTTRTSPVCTAFSRSFRPGLCITVPVMMCWWIWAASTPAPVRRIRWFCSVSVPPSLPRDTRA